MSNKIFQKYAKYYNLVYQEKKYLDETRYIHSLLKKFKSKNKILEIGCGTGIHANNLAKLNYDILGIDLSAEMISIAKKKYLKKKNIKFLKKNILDISYIEKFDTAISLFHVICYLTSKSKIKTAFKNINESLKSNGLFIFDFWYAPAVKKNKLTSKIKKFTSKTSKITRKVTPAIYSNNRVKINIEISISNKNNKLKENFSEDHYVKYFDYKELKHSLNMSGFKIIKCYEWLKEDKPTQNSWSALIVAKKV